MSNIGKRGRLPNGTRNYVAKQMGVEIQTAANLIYEGNADAIMHAEKFVEIYKHKKRLEMESRVKRQELYDRMRKA